MKNDISYLGIDIGGANLKIIGVNADKKVVYVNYSSCKIWKNQHYLDKKLLDDREKVEHLVYNDISTKKIKNQIKNLKKQWLKNITDVKTVMVMEEMKDKRKTFLYDRGSYQSPSFEVEADVPSKLPKMSAEMPKNRLGLSLIHI